MDNRKKTLTGSGWSEGIGSRFRQEPEIGKLAGTQESAGFGTTGPTGASVQVWRRFTGNKYPDPPPLSPHLCIFHLEFPERHNVFYSLVAFRLDRVYWVRHLSES